MVLRVETASGARWVYKGQWGAPHEAGFYRQARSPLLPRCQVLLEEPERSALLLEYVDAPNLCQRRPAEDEAAALARDLTHRIQEIQGDPPVVERLDSAERWREFQARTIQRVRLLGERRLIRPVAESVLGELARSASQSQVEDALADGTGLMHSDLHAENVFVLPHGGWKVVDWQKPRTGPLAVDRALLLETLEYDPLAHVSASAVLLMNFLRMGDCASCLWEAGWDPGGAAERHLLFRISGVLAVSPSARDTAQPRAPPL